MKTRISDEGWRQALNGTRAIRPNYHGEIAAGKREAKSKANTKWGAARLQEFRTSTELRLSVEQHNPKDWAKIRAAAKRKRDAEDWIESIKRRKK